MDSTTVATLRLAGALLLAGGVIFTIGACSPPYEQWYSPLKRALQVIAEHRAGWYWIHVCFVIGVLLTMFGFVVLAHGLRGDARATLLVNVVAAGYAVGAVFWLVNIAFRCTVQVWAAGEVARIDAIPAGFAAWQQFASVLFFYYSLLAYLACAGLGWAVIRTELVARWSGWFAVVFGLTGGFVVGHNIPFMIHIPLMIIGVLLMRL